ALLGASSAKRQPMPPVIKTRIKNGALTALVRCATLSQTLRSPAICFQNCLLYRSIGLSIRPDAPDVEPSLAPMNGSQHRTMGRFLVSDSVSLSVCSIIQSI